MSASYPGAVKSFSNRNSGDVIQPSHVNDLQDEVNAIEAGLLNGTANLQSSNSTILNLSVTRNSTLGSTITIGALPYIFPASGGSTGQALVIASTSGSTMTLAWQTPIVTLLKAGNGSDTAAAATVLDSIALTGLTANDRLRVEVTVTGVTQQTAQVTLYSVTDSLVLVAVSPSPLAAGDASAVAGSAVLGQRQGSATQAVGIFQGMLGTPARNDFILFTTPTTAWTGSWTLGLRHGGVTAGGTIKWSWAVYKLAGQ